MARPPPEPCGRAEGLEATDGEDVPPGVELRERPSMTYAATSVA
jgi:hypothetical protein